VTEHKSFVFRFEDIEVRENEYALTRAGDTVNVEPTAFRVLLYLLRHAGRLVTKDEIMAAVWHDTAVSDNSLTRCIAVLRRLLDDNSREPRLIATVQTVGYRFLVPVEKSPIDATPESEPVRVNGKPGGISAAPVGEQVADAGMPAQKKNETLGVTIPGKATEAGKQRLRGRWLLLGAGLLAALCAAAGYLHRPLQPPRISEYVQITHDGHPKILAGTDGIRLYFTQTPSTYASPHSLAEVAATGGEISQIPIALPGGMFLAVDVSSDGSSSLVASVEKGSSAFAFWSARLVGGSLHRLGNWEGAVYSPDGRSVAYTTVDGDLWIMASDGTAAHKVGQVGGGGAYMPAWSPDGSAIRFQRGDRIWEIASNGSNPHRLLPGWHDAYPQCCGHWTADGKFFMFVSGELWGNRGQIWALDERRGLLRRQPAEPIQLTSGPTQWGTPISSKDGRKIFAEGTSRHGELSRYDAQSKQIQPYLNGISAEGMAFSKDGESVAYVSYPEGILWKANRDGSNPVQLSQPPMYPLNPHWSPDGTQILFVDVSRRHALKSYIVPAEGGSPRQLLPEVEQTVNEPDWSPDAKKIVFNSFYLPAGEIPSGPGLHILDVASGQVTSVPGSEGLCSPRLSPDGRKIAALKLGSPSIAPGLTIFEMETQQWTTLVTKEGINFPAFSADSQFLYYLLLGSEQAVYRVRVKGGEPERVIDLKDWHMTGHSSFWMGLDPSDAPLLLRDDGTSDIYALTLEEK
jgi:DNA-binding winged helix-turn-helix (wHTH) protein/Tol biopolymer transport system component